MTKTDDRIDDLKEVVNNINNRLTNCENILSKTREEKLASDLEQYKMITKAVSEAISPLMEKLEEQNKRIVCLENSDAKKSQLLLKTIMATVITTTVGWIVLGFLNNYMALTTNKISQNISEEAYIYENVETFV